jgi:hypothetical protein
MKAIFCPKSGPPEVFSLTEVDNLKSDIGTLKSIITKKGF